MRAMTVTTPGGPDAMVLSEVPVPEPGPGQLRVAVTAAGVNFIDVYHRSGRYPIPTPFSPGLEGTGRIAALGEGVEGFAVGDRVAWMQGPGSYAEQVVVDATVAVPVPDEVDDLTAAALLLQGVTAHYLSHSTHPVRPGDDVLIHAAAGGVGLLLTQLVRARGGRVFATASTEAKAELARAAGAEMVFGYDDFAAGVAECTEGVGVRVVYDGVGASTFDGSIASLQPRGLMVLFGQSSGAVPPVDPQLLSRSGSLFLTRPTTAHYLADRAELLWRAGELFDAVRDGRLDVRIGGRYRLADAPAAHRDLEARRTTGKLLLLTDGRD